MAGVEDILQRRISLFFVYSVIFHVLLVLLFSFSGLQVLHPLVWFESALAKATTPLTWFYFFILSIFLLSLCAAIQKRFLAGPLLYTSRFNMIKSIFTPRNIGNAVLYAFVSVMISCVYLSLFGGDYSILYQKCDDDDCEGRTCKPTDQCIVEAKAFLLFCATLSGIYCYLHDYMRNSSFPVFPIIQQRKYIRLKAQFTPSIKQAMKKAISPCVLFTLIYFWRGDTYLTVVANVFNVEVSERLFRSVFDLLNVKLQLYLWLLTSIFMFTVIFMEHILNVILTEGHQFCVAPRFASTDILALHEILNPKQKLIFKNWAYLDLLTIAKNDYMRRQEIFTLSHPGGHPNNWNAILKECIKLIDQFSDDLSKAMTDVSIRAHETSKPPLLRAPPPPCVRPPAPDRFSTSMRNLSASDFETLTYPCDESYRELPTVLWEQFRESFIFHLSRLKHTLMKKQGIQYIFGRIPDIELKYLFYNCLPVIKAVQALSFLATASIKEDTYGVVQKDLAVIVSAIAELKNVMDKALKIGNVKRVQKNDFDVQMRASLKGTLSRSICRMCITFKEYLLTLYLSPVTYGILMGYMPVKQTY